MKIVGVKKPRNDKFLERVAGQPALPPPAPRPLPAEHPAKELFGGVTKESQSQPSIHEPNLEQQSRATVPLDASITLSDPERELAPTTIEQRSVAETATGEGREVARSGPNATVTKGDSDGTFSSSHLQPVAPGSRIQTPAEALPAKVTSDRTSASPKEENAFNPTTSSESFKKFFDDWSPFLPSTLMRLCEILFAQTVDQNREEFFATTSALAKQMGLSSRHTVNLLNDLQTKGFVEKVIVQENNKPLGLQIRFKPYR